MIIINGRKTLHLSRTNHWGELVMMAASSQCTYISYVVKVLGSDDDGLPNDNSYYKGFDNNNERFFSFGFSF